MICKIKVDQIIHRGTRWNRQHKNWRCNNWNLICGNQPILYGGQLIAPIIKTTSSVFGMGWTGPYSQGYSALSLEIYHEEDEEVNRSENKRKFDMYVPVK
jgi:hypothetical protein